MPHLSTRACLTVGEKPFTRIELSQAEVADRERLFQLHKKARYENDVLIVGDYADALAHSGYYEKTWYHEFPSQDDEVVKAEVDGTLVGFARFGAPHLVDRADEYPVDKLGPFRSEMGELHQIYLDNKFHGFGIGSKLYTTSLDGLAKHGYKHMFISTYEKNYRARGFYERMGATHWFDVVHNSALGDRIFNIGVAAYIHENILQTGSCSS